MDTGEYSPKKYGLFAEAGDMQAKADYFQQEAVCG